MADQELVGLSRVFDRMYCKLGRPSVAPEKILKSLLLIGLYSVRSEAVLRAIGVQSFVSLVFGYGTD